MKKLTVEVCIGTPCYLMGARELIDDMTELQNEYEDKIKFKTLHCIEERCENAPVVKVDGEIYEEMTPDKLREIILKRI